MKKPTSFQISLTLLAVLFLYGQFFGRWFAHPPDVTVYDSLSIYANYEGIGRERAVIGFMITLAAIVIWIGRRWAARLAVFFLALALIEYVLWAISSYQIWRTSEADGPTYLLLHGAMAWDFVIVFLIALLIVALAWGKKTR